MYKSSYFQGTEEPKPKKTQYKPDKRKPEQVRFTEPLYRNYDLYDTDSESGPGAGYHSMHKYKSISDFLKAKRKRMKGRYKADDLKVKAEFIYEMAKLAIDFPIDDQISSGPILGDSGSYSDSTPIGGILDKYLPLDDFEGKSPDKLNFGRDYVEDVKVNKYLNLEKLLDKFLNSAESPLYGLSDTVNSPEDLESPYSRNTGYGVTDSGNVTHKVE